MTNTILKIDQEKIRALQKSLKEQIFKSKRMSTEAKLNLFHTCIEDMEKSQDIYINNKTMYTKIKDTDIIKFYNLNKCHELKRSDELSGQCFIEMIVEPGGYKAANKNSEISFPTTAPSIFPIWDIYTPSIYETLSGLVSSKPYHKNVYGEEIYV